METFFIPNNEEKYMSFTKQINSRHFNKDGKDIDGKREY